MKKTFLTVFLVLFFLVESSFPAIQQGRIVTLGNLFYWWNNNSACSLVMDANTEKLGWSFIAGTISPITDVDLYFDISGTVTDTNFTIHIETDSSDAPSGSTLGAATSEFAGPAADGYIGLKTLGTNTGALTIGTKYWIVLIYSSGANLDGTDKVATKDTGFRYDVNSEGIRHYDGTNWTNTSKNAFPGWFIVQHSDSSFSGYGRDGNSTSSGVTDIYDTNKQGIRIKFGSQVRIQAVQVGMYKSGTPGNMTVRIYEGAVEKDASVARASSVLASSNEWVFQFDSPVLLTADTNIYVVFEQDGTSDANDYDFEVFKIISAYISTVLPTDYRFVYGSGADPTAFTVSTTHLPSIQLFVSDPATDFDQAAGGGGGGRRAGWSIQ